MSPTGTHTTLLSILDPFQCVNQWLSGPKALGYSKASPILISLESCTRTQDPLRSHYTPDRPWTPSLQPLVQQVLWQTGLQLS
jgi:hypothetical protein